MPLYEYVCPSCRNRFEKLGSMNVSTEAVPCPDCGSQAARALSVFASFTRGAGGEMQAVAGGGMCACGGTGA